MFGWLSNAHPSLPMYRRFNSSLHSSWEIVIIRMTISLLGIAEVTVAKWSLHQQGGQITAQRDGRRPREGSSVQLSSRPKSAASPEPIESNSFRNYLNDWSLKPYATDIRARSTPPAIHGLLGFQAHPLSAGIQPVRSSVFDDLEWHRVQ